MFVNNLAEIALLYNWWTGRESNARPIPCKGIALPIELPAHGPLFLYRLSRPVSCSLQTISVVELTTINIYTDDNQSPLGALFVEVAYSTAIIAVISPHSRL